jgi:hypothetical protein
MTTVDAARILRIALLTKFGAMKWPTYSPSAEELPATSPELSRPGRRHVRNLLARRLGLVPDQVRLERWQLGEGVDDRTLADERLVNPTGAGAVPAPL